MLKEASGSGCSDVLDHSPKVRDAEDAGSFWNGPFCAFRPNVGSLCACALSPRLGGES